MTGQARQTGAAGARVAANLRRIRATRGMSTYQLSARLTSAGWPIQQSGLTRIERGERYVTVDDLVALAAVLGCSPNRLLLPADFGRDDDVVGELRADSADMWAWACGEVPLLTSGGIRASAVDEAVFAIENRPHRHVTSKEG